MRRFPGRGTLENRLRRWCQEYEKKLPIKFYKLIIQRAQQHIQTDFKIDWVPAIVFMRNGQILDRIDDLNEGNPNIADKPLQDAESEDEKRIKQKIAKLCESSSSSSTETIADGQMSTE